MTDAPILLVVDDEPIVRESLSAWFREEGIRIETVDGAREALDRLAAGRRYAAMLVDVRMPGIDGLELLRRVKRADPRLPVAVMTAFGDISTERAAADAGADAFVGKPFDPDEMTAVIRKLIDTPRG